MENSNTVWSYTKKAGWKLPGIMRGVDPNKAYVECFTEDEIPRNLEEIVAIAKNKNSAIHPYFEWDNKIASHNYRLIQAQRMVKNFVLVKKYDDEEKTEEKTCFRLVEADSSRTSTYAPVKFFLKNEDEYGKLLERAKVELAGIKKRYSNIVELETIFSDIDELLAV